MTSKDVKGSNSCTIDYNGGTINVTHLLHLEGNRTALHLGIDFTNPAPTMEVFAAATVTGPGSLINPATGNLHLRNATINTRIDNLGVVRSEGKSSIQSMTNGEVGVMPRFLWDLAIVGDSSAGSATLGVPNGLTNYGVIELTSEDGPHDVTLTVLNGSLTNEPGGFIYSLPGTGEARVIIAQIVNHGTLELEQGTILGATSVVSSNSGLIDLNGGDLT